MQVCPEDRLDKVNLAQKFSLFNEPYKPKIVGEVNDLYVKVVKLQGISCGTTMTMKMSCSSLSRVS